MNTTKPCNKHRCDGGDAESGEYSFYKFCVDSRIGGTQIQEQCARAINPGGMSAVSDITICRNPPPLLLGACKYH